MRTVGIILIAVAVAAAYVLGSVSHTPTPAPHQPVALLSSPPPLSEQQTTASQPPIPLTLQRGTPGPLKFTTQGSVDDRGTMPEAPPTANQGSRNDKKAILSAAAVVALIIAASRNAYYSTGHPCACPEDRMRNNRRCGGTSAYLRAGGASPLCYPKDITTTMIEEYRARMSAR